MFRSQQISSLGCLHSVGSLFALTVSRAVVMRDLFNQITCSLRWFEKNTPFTSMLKLSTNKIRHPRMEYN